MSVVERIRFSGVGVVGLSRRWSSLCQHVLPVHSFAYGRVGSSTLESLSSSTHFCGTEHDVTEARRHFTTFIGVAVDAATPLTILARLHSRLQRRVGSTFRLLCAVPCRIRGHQWP